MTILHTDIGVGKTSLVNVSYQQKLCPAIKQHLIVLLHSLSKHILKELVLGFEMQINHKWACTKLTFTKPGLANNMHFTTMVEVK